MDNGCIQAEFLEKIEKTPYIKTIANGKII